METERETRPSTGAVPLAQVEEQEELMRRYRIYSSEVLRRWTAVVKGPHRRAMEALLKERGE